MERVREIEKKINLTALKKIIVGGTLICRGDLWNVFLLPKGGFWGDWIMCGRWCVSIGDLLFILAYSIIISIFWK